MWNIIQNKLKSKLIILLICCSIFVSCRKEFVIDYPVIPPTLVVNCLFTNDSVFNIQIGKLQYLNDTTDAIVKNAEVILYEDNIVFDTLNFNFSDKTYKSLKKAQIGKNYSIIVKADGFPTISASDKVPDSTHIDSANVYLAAYYDSWEEMKLEVVNLYFENEEEEENYYEVICYSKETYENSDSTVSQYFKFPNFITSLDPVILNEGILDQNKYQPALIFGDRFLNSNAKIIFMPFLQLSNSLYIPESYVVLRNVSKNYFLFRKKWYKYLQTNAPTQMNGIAQLSNMSFVSDPSEAFSNIENGLGIFAAYSETQKLMQLKTEK